MRLFTTLLVFAIIFPGLIQSQGIIEAEAITVDTVQSKILKSDTLYGDARHLTNVPKNIQNLSVSFSGDTLFITEGNWVLIPGLSASNSGSSFANAGVDIYDACVSTFNLSAAPMAPNTTGQWIILSGIGGSLIDAASPNANFVGLEGEAYLLQWNVTNQNGSGSFGQLNISIAENTMTSVANAGKDSFAIMEQTISLYANAPGLGSQSKWTVFSGAGGILGNINDSTSNFTGVPGEVYTLRW